MKTFLIGILSFWLLLGPLVLAEQKLGHGRFFIEGNGTVRLKNLKNGRRATITYRTPDGEYPEQAQAAINRLFGLKASESLDRISLRFIALLDFIQETYGGHAKTIDFNSAYRSPIYNKTLRDKGGTVAKASTHMEGMAADIRIAGVDGKGLWESLKERDCCGVGWYGGASVHVDTGPSRYWTDETSKVRSNISDDNKQILLRTDRDIYKPGETVHMRLVRVTRWPFGVKRQAALVGKKGKKEKRIRRLKLESAQNGTGNQADCLMIKDREQARDLSWSWPEDLSWKIWSKAYSLYIKVEFCERPSEDMPESVVSNRIEIRESL